MPVIIAFSIIALSMVVILYKTYFGYGQYSWYTKLGFILFLTVSIIAPIICFKLRHYELNGYLLYLPKILYFLFGFVFILFLITILRDIFWLIWDVIRRTPLTEMKEPAHLQTINIITFICCLLLCIYGFYEAEKPAEIVTHNIVSAKIKTPVKVVMLSDLHIEADVSPNRIKKMVNRINKLDPDAIVLVGDLIDDTSVKLYKQMEALKELKAKKGVFFVLGNHEFYNGAMDWSLKLAYMGFAFLNNTGVKLDNSEIFIAGIPDINTVANGGMKVKLDNALYGAKKDDYVIMLSHTPKIAEGITKENVDLQLSAHTHGGQIYPFHYLAKQNNDGHLAGFYDENGVKMYVSRGTRYWGPPMRIFAPSEITVFNFIPEKNDE